MNKTDECIWLLPLIITEKYNSVLLIGNYNPGFINKVNKSTCEFNGKLIVANRDNEKFKNENYITCNSSVRNIFPVLQMERIKPNIIVIDEQIDGIHYLAKDALNKDGLLLVKNNIVSEEVEKKLSKNCSKLLKSDKYTLYYSKKTRKNAINYEEIKNRILSIESSEFKKNKNDIPVVGVGVLTYNHDKYITECLDGIFNQIGNFKIKLYIIDDCSTTDNQAIIDDYLEKNKNDLISVDFIKNEKNQGVISNFKKLVDLFKNTDYFSFCEGDDVWVSKDRVSKFINYMSSNPFVSIAFNDLYIYDDEDGTMKSNLTHKNLKSDYYNTRDLILNYNLTGNLGCCFYNSSYIDFIPKNLFDQEVYDFYFNTIYSTFGFIGHIPECLSIYRYHNNSFWSSQNANQKNINMYKLIKQYNKNTGFVYDYEYRKYGNALLTKDLKSKCFDKDIVIIDSIFPTGMSQFTYQEITSYFKHFNSIICLSSGLSLVCFKDINHDVELQNYRIENPDLYDKVTDYTTVKADLYNPKLLYFIFYSTVNLYWDYILQKNVPFVFELYPGGGFVFDDDVCDNNLRRIMSSKNFKKVIVTQKAVKDYLLKKKLCSKDKIELIFGVVTPLKSIEKAYTGKLNFGINKSDLDIVFMAHKYTKKGVDKGYDTFIDAAKKLSKLHENIKFHVVGGFNKEDIDVSDISDKIKFYGGISGDKFDTFFADKDIIISPNIPFKIFKGSFDGFPTASCTEAGLRKTAIFCTDPLKMNDNIYTDGKDIVIIEPNSDDVVKKVEYFYKNPKKLKSIGVEGAKSIRNIYSYDRQIKPRIEILEKVLGGKK